MQGGFQRIACHAAPPGDALPGADYGARHVSNRVQSGRLMRRGQEAEIGEPAFVSASRGVPSARVPAHMAHVATSGKKLSNSGSDRWNGNSFELPANNADRSIAPGGRNQFAHQFGGPRRSVNATKGRGDVILPHQPEQVSIPVYTEQSHRLCLATPTALEFQ